MEVAPVVDVPWARIRVNDGEKMYNQHTDRNIRVLIIVSAY
jgi:hypothetical protein